MALKFVALLLHSFTRHACIPGMLSYAPPVLTVSSWTPLSPWTRKSPWRCCHGWSCRCRWMWCSSIHTMPFCFSFLAVAGRAGTFGRAPPPQHTAAVTAAVTADCARCGTGCCPQPLWRSISLSRHPCSHTLPCRDQQVHHRGDARCRGVTVSRVAWFPHASRFQTRLLLRVCSPNAMHGGQTTRVLYGQERKRLASPWSRHIEQSTTEAEDTCRKQCGGTALIPGQKKETDQIGHHARPRRASATAPLRTGADTCKTGSGAGKRSGAKSDPVRRRSNHAWTEDQASKRKRANKDAVGSWRVHTADDTPSRNAATRSKHCNFMCQGEGYGQFGGCLARELWTHPMRNRSNTAAAPRCGGTRLSRDT